MSPDRKITPTPDQVKFNFLKQPIEKRIIDMIPLKKLDRLFIGINQIGIPVFIEPTDWTFFEELYSGIAQDLEMMKNLSRRINLRFEHTVQRTFQEDGTNDIETVLTKWAIRLTERTWHATLNFNGQNLGVWYHFKTRYDALDRFPRVTKDILRPFEELLILQKNDQF